MRRSTNGDDTSCPTYVPASSTCTPITVAAITNEVDTGESGRPWQFEGTVSVPIGSETFNDWSLLIRFSQRVQAFDASFDSFRDRDNEHEPIQQRWMLGPKQQGQPLTGNLEFTVEGKTEFDGTQVDAWWCPGESGILFELATECSATDEGNTGEAPTVEDTAQPKGLDRLRRESAGEVISKLNAVLSIIISSLYLPQASQILFCLRELKYSVQIIEITIDNC